MAGGATWTNQQGWLPPGQAATLLAQLAAPQAPRMGFTTQFLPNGTQRLVPDITRFDSETQAFNPQQRLAMEREQNRYDRTDVTRNPALVPTANALQQQGLPVGRSLEEAARILGNIHQQSRQSRQPGAASGATSATGATSDPTQPQTLQEWWSRAAGRVAGTQPGLQSLSHGGGPMMPLDAEKQRLALTEFVNALPDEMMGNGQAVRNFLAQHPQITQQTLQAWANWSPWFGGGGLQGAAQQRLAQALGTNPNGLVRALMPTVPAPGPSVPAILNPAVAPPFRGGLLP